MRWTQNITKKVTGILGAGLLITFPLFWSSTFSKNNEQLTVLSSKIANTSFPQQTLNYELDEYLFDRKNEDLSWKIQLVSVDIKCISTSDILLLQYFLNPAHQEWAFVNRGQLADLIANIQITFTFYQQILDYNNMELYESYPTFTTTCYDDSHEIIYTPTFSYIDSNLFGINVPSIFQASGFYGFSDPAASAYIANILMVSWDSIREEMVLKIDYSNLPDYIDKRAHTFGWDLLGGEAFYGKDRKTIAFPMYDIILS